MIKNGILINLKDKQVHQLLKLEELFHSHYLTEELLNEMISLYVRFVENIHTNQHPLRIFFMEKIKFVLSRPQVLRILEKETLSKGKNMRDTIRGVVGISEEQQLFMKQITQETKEEIRQNHVINMKKERSPNGSELKQKQRTVKIEMQMKIMEEMQDNMKKFAKDLAQVDMKRQKKTNQIITIVNQQDQSLNQRLEKRKKRRKKSADLTEKQLVQVEIPKPIPIEQLKAVQKEIQKTYQRFTRLTQNRMGTNKKEKENQGRVKMKVQENPFEQQDLFEEQNKQAFQQHSFNFSKKKQPQNEVKPIKQPSRGTQTTTIEYKTFDQNKGRVTMRTQQYEEIQQDAF